MLKKSLAYWFWSQKQVCDQELPPKTVYDPKDSDIENVTDRNCVKTKRVYDKKMFFVIPCQKIVEEKGCLEICDGKVTKNIKD